MFVTCVDTYSLEAGDVGKYRTPVARFAHRTLKAAENHRRRLIRRRTYPLAKLFYVAYLIEGEKVAR